MFKLISPLQTIESSKTKNKNLTLTLDEILERVLKQHEENPKKENEDLVDIQLKVCQDDKAEFKITRTHIKAFLSISNVC
jgi:hypothetical protein